jgi:hypothetical protein
MDITTVFGTVVVGSIPARRTLDLTLSSSCNIIRLDIVVHLKQRQNPTQGGLMDTTRKEEYPKGTPVIFCPKEIEGKPKDKMAGRAGVIHMTPSLGGESNKYWIKVVGPDGKPVTRWAPETDFIKKVR